jgi:hypothetical protein
MSAIERGTKPIAGEDGPATVGELCAFQNDAGLLQFGLVASISEFGRIMTVIPWWAERAQPIMRHGRRFRCHHLRGRWVGHVMGKLRGREFITDIDAIEALAEALDELEGKNAQDHD